MCKFLGGVGASLCSFGFIHFNQGWEIMFFSRGNYYVGKAMELLFRDVYIQGKELTAVELNIFVFLLMFSVSSKPYVSDILHKSGT